MDHAGEECVPRQVSLLEAHMNQPSRVALLQAPRRLRLRAPLEVGADLPPDYTPPLADARGAAGRDAAVLDPARPTRSTRSRARRGR